jgi:putative peptide zinc metalloprotease protein
VNSTIPINYELFDAAELTKVDQKTFAINYDGRIFYIGEILYDIITRVKERKGMDEIKEEMNAKFNVSMDEEKMQEAIVDCVYKLENRPKNKTTLYTYIYGKLRIISEAPLRKITRFFTFLFNKWILMVLFVVSFLLSFYFMGVIFTSGLLTEKITLTKSIKYLLINYVFIVFAGLFHELGHSSASARYKIHSKEIGFGFYLVFPVFYTDVSRIWLLDKYRRIVVNLGGVYFQFMLNALIVLFYFVFQGSFQDKVMIKTLFLANSSMCIYSLNPFFRNDGYWIYSDFFNIPNLVTRAVRYPGFFFRTYLRNEEKRARKDLGRQLRKEIPLLIYSFLYNLMMLLLWVGLAFLTYKNFTLVRDLARDKSFTSNIFTLDHIFRLIGVIFSCAINIFFVYRSVKFYGARFFRKNTTQQKDTLI